MAHILRQKISNHPLFEDVERFVVIDRIAENADVAQIVIDARLEYEKDGQDVSSNFKTRIQNWIVGNHYQVVVRDQNNEPIPNPEYDPEENPDVSEFLTMPAFDYFHSLILANQVPLITLLSINVLNDDEKGAFNF